MATTTTRNDDADARAAVAPFRPGEDGPWDRAAAAHLSRRATFGSPPELVDRILALGPEKAARELLSRPDEKSSASEGGDGDNLRAVAQAARSLGDTEAVQAWWVYRMLLGPTPALDKLALFWHGHFATSDEKVDDARLMMRQVELFLAKGAGPFDALLLEVSRDPAMLLWLDGNSNRRGKPNENYARELMELFSLGIGNYTEDDIKEAARAFTGWHVRRREFFFNRRAHDAGEKTVFGKQGKFGGEDVVALCLEKRSLEKGGREKPACAEFISSKLFEYYVAPRPEPCLRQALGELYESCGKHTGDFLARLWSSRAFYSSSARRSLVSSPAEFVVGSLKTLSATANAQHLARAMARMGQDLLRPPSVKGWNGGMAWLNSNTLLARFRFAAALAAGGGGGGGGGGELEASVCWEDLEAEGADGIAARFFPEGLSEEVLSPLKEAAAGHLELFVPGCLELPECQYV